MSAEAGASLPRVMEEIWNEALGHEHQRNPQGAANAYATYLIFQLSAGQPFDLHVVDRLSRCLEQLGNGVEAIRTLSAVRNQVRAAGDRSAETFLVLRMAQVGVMAGEPASAERWLADVEDEYGRWEAPQADRSTALLERASALTWQGGDAADSALFRVEASVALGRLWASRGKYADAQAAIQQALALNTAEVFHTRKDLALWLAELQLDRGDFNRAEEVARQYAPQPVGDEALSWEVVRVQGLLMSGRLGEARVRALQALEAPRLKESRGTLHLRWLVAQALVQLNRSAEAEKAIALALERMPPGGNFRGWAARFSELRQLNEHRAGLGGVDWEPARLPEQVLEIGEEDEEDVADSAAPADPAEPRAPARRRERFVDEWAARALRVQRALYAGNLDLASQRLTELLQLVTETDAEWLRTRTRYFVGLVAYARGEYEAALEAFSIARAHAATAGLLMQAWESQRCLSWACARLGRTEEHALHAAKARELLDSIVASLDPLDGVYFALNKWTARDEYVASRALWLERFEPRPFPVPWLQGWWRRRERSRASARVLKELNELVAWRVDRVLAPKSAKQEPGAPHLVDPEQANTTDQVARWIEARQEQALRHSGKQARWHPEGPVAGWPWRMPRRVAVMQFHVLADRLLVFLVTRREVRCQTFHGVTRIRLRQLSDEALAAIQEQSPARARALLEKLARLMGLQELLDGVSSAVNRLVVIPSDALVNVPFAALPYGEGWLCERFAVSLLPHASMFSPSLGQGAKPLGTRRFVGVGVRHYPGESLRELPRAVEEVEAAARHLAPKRPPTLLRDAEARPDAIRAALQEADWAHFACHGKVESTDMLSTRLHVASSGGTPGRLTLAELQQLPLEKLRGMVLAACWLSSTLFLPGNELVGLPAGLMRAGVGTVIASLWEVDDEANFQFMTRFYELASQRGAVWALREVQREWAQREDTWALPFYWASYVLYGGDR